MRGATFKKTQKIVVRA